MGLMEGGLPTLVVPVCSRVVRLDMGTTNPSRGDQEVCRIRVLYSPPQYHF
jgi:hypothetical protein